jgi:hypothetical protein
MDGFMGNKGWWSMRGKLGGWRDGSRIRRRGRFLGGRRLGRFIFLDLGEYYSVKRGVCIYGILDGVWEWRRRSGVRMPALRREIASLI